MTSLAPFSFFLIKSKRRGRSGVSPVISSVIMVGISVTLGLSLWSWANSGVNASTASYTNEVTDYVNYVNDRFVIVNFAFEYDGIDEDQFQSPYNVAPFNTDGCSADDQSSNDEDCVTVWVYNYGEIPLQLSEVLFGEQDGVLESYDNCNNAGINPLVDKCFRLDLNDYSAADAKFQIDKNSIGKITINYGEPTDLQFVPGETYAAKIVSTTGSLEVYYQKR